MRALLAALALTGALFAAGCGAPATGPAPRACSLLADSDIQAATGDSVSGEGGGDTAGQSTCSWALGNAAGGSVILTEHDCSGAGCATLFDRLAPAAGSEITGAGSRSRMAGTVAVVQGAREVVVVTVDSIDRPAGVALPALARAAAGRLG